MFDTSPLIAHVLNSPFIQKILKSVPVLVGRGPPFAYWRKVGLQAYTKICSGVLCNIVVNIVMFLHIRVVVIER